MIRHELFELVLNLKDIGCTAIFTSEIPAENQAALSKFGVEEFLTDGVIALYYNRTNGFSRALTVWKMRGVDHDKKVRPYKITKDGIVVYSKEEAIMGK
jgi:KaiC/GvpD/RAD55 family RecA-like ATPase